MTKKETLIQIQALTQSLIDEMVKEVGSVKPLEGVTPVTGCRGAVVSLHNIMKYNTLDMTFYLQDVQCQAMTRYINDSPSLEQALARIQKMAHEKKIGDTRLNPNSINALNHILHEFEVESA